MIRFATYNLLTGGIDEAAPGAEPRRLAQAAILAPLEVDVLALQECTGWEADDWWRLYWLANKLELVVLDKAQTQRRTGSASPNWTILLYRADRLRVVAGTGDVGRGAFHHGAVRAHFITRDDAEHDFLVDAIHASWTDGETRLAESRWHTDRAKDRSILLGDLNAGLPTDPEPDWTRIPRHLHSRYRLTLPDGSYGPADRRSTANLLGAGYVDPAARLGLRPAPTTGHWYPNEPEPQHFDHILVGAELSRDIVAYRTVDTDQAKDASDHLPKVLDIAT